MIYQAEPFSFYQAPDLPLIIFVTIYIKGYFKDYGVFFQDIPAEYNLIYVNSNLHIVIQNIKML